jgi:hypothetical protein
MGIVKRKKSKKRKYKKIKGVKYIAQKLRKYFPKRYKTYSEALVRAYQIKDKISESGQKVGVLSIFDVERIKRIPKQVPEFPDSLSNPDNRYYFAIDDMLNEISTETSNEIFFSSEIGEDDDFEIQGGTELPALAYEENFKNFVSFLESQRRSNRIDYNDLRVLATEPIYNTKNKRWESKIIITDTDGNPDTIDPEVQKVLSEFNPSIKYSLAPSEEEKKSSKKKTREIGLSQAEIEAQKEIAIEQLKSNERKEKEKQKTLQKALDMVMANKMSWEKYDELLARLYPDK